MIENIKTGLYLIFLIFIVGLFISGIIALIQIIDEHDKINAEWQQKVNACIINENCRKDCKLIIYRDIQIHNQKIDSERQSSAMTGGIVGGMLGASMVRK